MIRRSFRLGLVLGLLAGLAYALARLLELRGRATEPASPRSAEPWPPLPAPRTPAPEPTAQDLPPAAEAARTDAAASQPLPTEPTPTEPTTQPRSSRTPSARWVVPNGDVCPTSHPVKAKLSSKIFHLPGMASYDRTRPDRCYRDGIAAEGDGLRPAKR